jgi:hypothetical protein
MLKHLKIRKTQLKAKDGTREQPRLAKKVC